MLAATCEEQFNINNFLPPMQRNEWTMEGHIARLEQSRLASSLKNSHFFRGPLWHMNMKTVLEKLINDAWDWPAAWFATFSLYDCDAPCPARLLKAFCHFLSSSVVSCPLLHHARRFLTNRSSWIHFFKGQMLIVSLYFKAAAASIIANFSQIFSKKDYFSSFFLFLWLS